MDESRVRLITAVANGGLTVSLGWLALAGRPDLRWPLLLAAAMTAVLCVSAAIGPKRPRSRTSDDSDHR